MTPKVRDDVLERLRQPGLEADMLIEAHLNHPGEESGCRSYTSNVEDALQLVPSSEHILCGRFHAGKMFWCDVGFRPQVQIRSVGP